MFKADLHTHSIFSDGTDTPEELIQLAIESGLSGLSITDHDTVAAYERAMPFAQEKNFPLLPGIEFSCIHHGTAVHVLGYAYSLESTDIAALCNRHQKRRAERNQKILEKLRGLGIKIDSNQLGVEGRTLGRPHIAKAMMQQGLVKSIQEAFDRYLGEGKPAFDPGEPVSIEETIEVIHRAGGKAIIAHPHLIQRRSIIRHLLQMSFDGIEGYYARFDSAREKEWIETGIQKGWIVTGGSDYHGATKPFNRIGSSWVGEDTFKQLYEHYLANYP